MPKARQTFRRTDVMRGVKAVIDSGLSVSMVRISPQGQIEIETGTTQVQDSTTDLERWLARKGANHARPS